MNRFEEYYMQKGLHADKWDNYLEVYDEYFQRFLGKDVINILEIGLFKGESLKMWDYYFDKKVNIFGIDINQECKKFESKNIKIFIGSQSDKKFLEYVKSVLPKIDILIDDGGHTMKQQIYTFNMLFDHIKEDGLYVCEDVHTSYWLTYGGGYKRMGSFIEFSKKFIDKIHARYSEQKNFKVDEYTKSIRAIHYYDSMVLIEKRKTEAPKRIITINNSSKTKVKKIRMLIAFILKRINKVLAFFRLPSFYYGRR